MEALQCSARYAAGKIGAVAAKLRTNESGSSTYVRRSRNFVGLNRNSSAADCGLRKSCVFRQPYAALALEDGSGVDEKQNVDRSSNGRSLDSVQEEQSMGLRSFNKKAVVARNYIQHLPELLKDDAGPPRWFCPMLETEAPQNAPLFLFLPEVVSTGLGFAMQQESLSRLFELRCLHIPLMDRTSFEGLVSFVEETVREEVKLNPGRPVYLLGESFGGALAMAVAARNPSLDLVLILVNPTTSFDQSQLLTIAPLIEAVPPALFPAVPLLLGLFTYDPVQLAAQVTSNITSGTGQMIPENVAAVVQSLLKVVNVLPQSTLPWKLKMLQSSARYVNSRIRAIKADILILASQKDQLLPSLEEAKRISTILPNCTYRKYTQSGHMKLVEESFDLATAIKGAGFYRQTKTKDDVKNFIPPTPEELAKAIASTALMHSLVSPVFFSTGDDGQIVPGLSMIPTSKKPLIFVGNHTFYGFDMGMIWSELVTKVNILPRGLAHPILFNKTMLEENMESVEGDRNRLFGAVPVSGRNMFKLLDNGDSIALYPGGAREALHRKGEWHKLFWPDRPEIIRMAAKFGATFVPMCAVGGDDIYEILLDYDDLVNLPIVGDQIFETFDQLPKWREDLGGDVGDQTLHTPLAVPKFGGPGRLYVLFGKPIYTEGKKEFYSDAQNVEAEYRRLKARVEDGLAYLSRKRTEDPYREFLPRIAYEVASGGKKQAPTFEP